MKDLDELARLAILKIQKRFTIPHCQCAGCVAIGVLHGYHCVPTKARDTMAVLDKLAKAKAKIQSLQREIEGLLAQDHIKGR